MRKILISIVTLLLFSMYGLYQTDNLCLPTKLTNKEADSSKVESANERNLSGLVYQAPNQVIQVNKNLPNFTKSDLSLDNGNWQKFSNLDQFNRVGEANAMLHKSMMPHAEREALYINPTAWKNKKNDTGWLYNRSHLIGYQLTGENNNPKNLMTGTRSLNTPGMLDFENEVATYLRKTDNHVRYRITPIFRDNELLARGVQMEAQSIEDSTLQFDVYIFNVETGMVLNYKDGSSHKQKEEK
ncbi:DNA/RNA non-specific endonuclease [Listeria seeligeri]|uniref:DNA/RNA non-specific endonuclease n=1 Tax=Listeria seeligeri TaxID=1640 RepID=UPI001626C910|nr:DNA/RNA non-specific endonuclease [Listeria seeligeri]MBC1746893.1 DNA/RNA non-specific endonuclease [Listeria seeligeri]MBC2233032.1 DNA/RNA non-specific endonuclease [Listeria seeligeri]MBF2626138.1 DNA/RNA non-specific endonuclease [Listeria seeligeri]MBF2673468.1 DNA/RNA non-specific endonuclease [Listeria seeligeri]